MGLLGGEHDVGRGGVGAVRPERAHPPGDGVPQAAELDRPASGEDGLDPRSNRVVVGGRQPEAGQGAIEPPEVPGGREDDPAVDLG